MSVSLKVSKREVRPRSIRNKLRHEGKIPAIVNGYKVESTPIAIDAKEFDRILRAHGLNTVITLTIDSKKVNTLVQDYSSDTFTGQVTHVAFLSVDMKEETEVEAEVVLTGESAGVKAGGVLTQNLYSVIVSATPDNLPEKIEVDISELSIGQSITVADLVTTSDFTVVTDSAEQICAISEARAAEETVEEAPAAE